MPNIRIITALAATLLVPFLAWGQAAAPKAPAAAGTPAAPAEPGKAAPTAAAKTEPTEAEKALDAAIAKVEALKSVSADIVQVVDMLGQHFELRGRYLKAPDYRIYLKLSVSGLGDTRGDMLQVCDGKTLWDFQQILTSRACTKVDAAKIIKKLESPDFNRDLRKQALERIGFAGPEALLTGLRKTLKFYHKEAGTLDGKPVWVLRGEWKDVSALIGATQPPMPGNLALPPYIPSIAQVWIGQDDGWPYQVRLEGRERSVLEDVREIGPDGKPLGAKRSARQVEVSKVLLTYSNVQLNPDLDKNLFAFTAPAETPAIDTTDQFLISLEQAAAAQQAQERSAAAKEPELPQSIPVPKPAPAIPGGLPKFGPAPLEKDATAPR